MTPPLFEIKGLSVDAREGHLWKRKTKTILHDLSFSIGEGQSVAYLGPNGAGKTTTFRAICGLASMVRGTFLWEGRAISSETLCRHIGFLPEIPYFYRNLTPKELLTGLGRFSRKSNRELQNEISNWAQRLNFEEFLNRPMRTCSKGQLQRIGLTQALMRKPRLLILDEPMSGLDPIGREIVRTVLLETNRNGTSLLFSSHILSDAESICHKLVALNQGHIIFQGDFSALVSESDRWQVHVGSIQGLSLNNDLILRQLTDATYIIEGTGGIHHLQSMIHQLSQSSDSNEIIHAGMVRVNLEDAFVHLLDSHKEGKQHHV